MCGRVSKVAGAGAADSISLSRADFHTAVEHEQNMIGLAANLQAGDW